MCEMKRIIVIITFIGLSGWVFMSCDNEINGLQPDKPMNVIITIILFISHILNSFVPNQYFY
jgi:hypothetical protein